MYIFFIIFNQMRRENLSFFVEYFETIKNHQISQNLLIIVPAANLFCLFFFQDFYPKIFEGNSIKNNFELKQNWNLKEFVLCVFPFILIVSSHLSENKNIVKMFLR